MADVRVTGLPAASSLANGDVLHGRRVLEHQRLVGKLILLTDDGIPEASQRSGKMKGAQQRRVRRQSAGQDSSHREHHHNDDTAG